MMDEALAMKVLGIDRSDGFLCPRKYRMVVTIRSGKVRTIDKSLVPLAQWQTSSTVERINGSNT